MDEGGKVVGLYILHPNNVGRCGHICNASYAVSSKCRGRHIGEKLVLDCLAQAKKHGFGVLQFNAVVEGNIHARHLYERLGFTQLGTIPRGFRMKDGSFANICPYYKEQNSPDTVARRRAQASGLYYSPPGKLRFPVMLSSSIR